MGPPNKRMKADVVMKQVKNDFKRQVVSTRLILTLCRKRLDMKKYRILSGFLLGIGLVISVSSEPVAGNRRDNVRIEIATAKRDGFVSCRIRNVSKNKIGIGMMSCSVWDNWVIDGEDVVLSWPPMGCTKNGCGLNYIKPGEFLAYEVPVKKKAGTKEKLRFRIGLVTCRAGYGDNNIATLAPDIYWSDELELLATHFADLTDMDKKYGWTVGRKPLTYEGGVEVLEVK